MNSISYITIAIQEKDGEYIISKNVACKDGWEDLTKSLADFFVEWTVGRLGVKGLRTKEAE